ncbi:MAG: GNAT family N-acetyltransferase [Pseudomonadota bacterium]
MSQAQQKDTPKLSVEFVEKQLSENDLNDLCDATDAAIEAGGGFGWVDLPAREILEAYWSGVITAPTRQLFVARLDDTICGTTQIVLPPKYNQAQGHMVELTTNFVAPWARGYGLAKTLLQEVEKKCIKDGYAVINLDVREHMERAISLYESLGYEQFGLHPYGAVAHGETMKSRFYYKVINPDYFK